MTVARASLLLALAGFGLAGAISAKTVDRPYTELESTLLQRLDFVGADPTQGPRTAWIVDRELRDCLREALCVQVSHYEPGQRIRLSLGESYDIGGIGSRSLTIDLRRLDRRRSQVEVHYLDRAVGFFLFPFAYVNPGWIREPRIASCLARLEGAPKEIEKIPLPTPRPGPEPPCERLQGRSCGPPGAVLLCDTASGNRLQCTCRGVLDCR